MSFADNWARVFVVTIFLTFGEAQAVGGVIPNLIASGVFLGAIGYFVLTLKIACIFKATQISLGSEHIDFMSTFGCFVVFEKL